MSVHPCNRVAVPASRRPARSLSLAMIAAVVVAVGGGCDVVTSVGPQSCDVERSENEPVTFKGGTVEDGVYMSSPWDENLIYFPGGMQVRLEHGLGDVPRTWTAYLSFQKDGLKNGGSMAPAAGNQLELVEMNDLSMTFHNSTCADYYLLVTAQSGSSAPEPIDG